MKKTSEEWQDGLPVSIQQNFKIIRDREPWTTKKGAPLSNQFESLISSPEFDDIAKQNGELGKIDFIAELLMYLRIEQATLLIKMLPDEIEKRIISDASNASYLIETANKNEIDRSMSIRNALFNRLDTLAKLHMIERIFDTERRTFILNLLNSMSQGGH